MKMITLLLMGTMSLSAYAQKSNKEDCTPPMLLRSVGVSFQQFDGLNSRIAGLPAYKTIRDYTGTIGFGYIRVNKNFVSDIDLSAGNSMSGDRNKRSSNIRYLGVGIDLGYDVIPGKKIMLYPMVGVGSQAYMARFYKDVSAVPFNAVLTSSDVQNSIRSVSFTNSFYTYRLGLGFAVKPGKDASGLLGIRVGYTGSFKDKAWKSNENQELAGAPVDGISQFNVSLTIMNMPRWIKMK